MFVHWLNKRAGGLMGLRDQFVQRLMPYLGQSYPISARDAFSQSLEIAEWVSRWIASQRLPTRTLEETVAASLAFKDAIGASTSIGRASDSVGEDIVEAHIHRCPIAGLSRAHPNLCYVTCGVIGTVTSHHQGPLWVSLEHTLAWDDHPCHIIVARTEHPPQGKCRARFPVDSDAAEALVSETEPIAPVVRYPEKVLMSSLTRALSKPSPTIEDVLAASAGSLGWPAWFEDTSHRVWGEPPRIFDGVICTQIVRWHQDEVGHVFTVAPSGTDPESTNGILSFVAHLVATCWAEGAAIGSWHADAESRFVSLLISPDGIDKPSWIRQWENVWPSTSVCPSVAVVWYHASTDGANDPQLLANIRNISRGLGVAVWVARVHDGFWTAVIHSAQVTPEQQDVLRSIQKVLSVQTQSPVAMGLGGMALEESELSRSFNEACEAAKLAKTLKKDVVSWENIPGMRLVPYFKEHPELLRLCHELLEPLRREDRLHGSQLVTTLETYLKFKMSAKKTSQALFIHPGTLKYRLHKIQVLTGWDLHSPYALFEVLTCMFLSTDVQEPFKGTGW